MISYFCKLCGRLDEEGITGHATARCKPLGMVANKAVVVNKPVKVVANKRTKDRHKNKEARLAYARALMRKKRAAEKEKRGNLRPH